MKDTIKQTVALIRKMVGGDIKAAIVTARKEFLGEATAYSDKEIGLVKESLETKILEVSKPVEIPDYRKEMREVIKEELSYIKFPEDGRDALEIEVLPEIDEENQYVRGTFAQHKGGLWRSFETTRGMKGWECIVEGISNIQIEYDGERKAKISVERSAGGVDEHEFRIPAMIGKGVWRKGEYEQGDTVQLSGSTWFATKPTDQRPGEGEDWVLAAKVGGTGKSAYDIARKAGFEGTKEQWLDSLGKRPVVKVGG